VLIEATPESVPRERPRRRSGGDVSRAAGAIRRQALRPRRETVALLEFEEVIGSHSSPPHFTIRVLIRALWHVTPRA